MTPEHQKRAERVRRHLEQDRRMRECVERLMRKPRQLVIAGIALIVWLGMVVYHIGSGGGAY